jgi:hypothetical protein
MCPKGFSNAGDLRKHLRLHTGLSMQLFIDKLFQAYVRYFGQHIMGLYHKSNLNIIAQIAYTV